MTIGEFARASRLSSKALRLYDELGLLTPARVDPSNGYRLYDPAQLEQARLVAWLRRLGMPLARIRNVCELAPMAAAQEIRAFWAQVETDTTARRGLAAFLIDHLSGKDPAVSNMNTPLGIRYAALTDTGLVRESNQDAAYAGSHLLAVADGFGSRGESASAAAIEALKTLEADSLSTDSLSADSPEADSLSAGNLLNILDDAIGQANQAVREIAEAAPTPSDVGTTLTAMLWTGSQLALVHIGDSRAYLLRGGELFQITHDHTFVQSMVDEGRITPEEATTHPQRSLLLRALTGDPDTTPQIHLQEARSEDRYLLCSDGLSAVLSTNKIHQVVSTAAGPEPAVRELVAAANRSGGPDNVSCVVADVIKLSR